MSVAISAPYPKSKVTTILPDPQFGNTRKSESSIQLKRTMTGRVVSYIRSSDKEELQFTFIMTRQKDFELLEFVRVYNAADWKLIDHNGKEWKVQLVGEPIRRTAAGRSSSSNTSSTGGETRQVTLTFSAEAL